MCHKKRYRTPLMGSLGYGTGGESAELSEMHTLKMPHNVFHWTALLGR